MIEGDYALINGWNSCLSFDGEDITITYAPTLESLIAMAMTDVVRWFYQTYPNSRYKI